MAAVQLYPVHPRRMGPPGRRYELPDDRFDLFRPQRPGLAALPFAVTGRGQVIGYRRRRLETGVVQLHKA